MLLLLLLLLLLLVVELHFKIVLRARKSMTCILQSFVDIDKFLNSLVIRHIIARPDAIICIHCFVYIY